MSVLLSFIHLRSFLAVVEYASVTAASFALGYTQSAVSLHIKALERDLGANLFHRDRTGMPLTDVGISFLPEARAMVDSLVAAERRMRAAAMCGRVDDSALRLRGVAESIPQCREELDGNADPISVAQHSI